jgi:N-acyl-D-amino-acid deacylase
MIAYVSSPENKRFEGLRMDEVAQQMGKDAAEAAMDLLIAEKCRVSAIFFRMSEENLREVYSWPFVMVGSDSGVRSATGPTRTGKPHPRAFGTPTRFLGRYVREAGCVSLAEGVRKLTGLPAQRIGLKDRGLLHEGYAADVTVFDPDTVVDQATYEDPFHYSLGIAHVLVNGAFVVRDGKAQGARPGRMLRRGQ